MGRVEPATARAAGLLPRCAASIIPPLNHIAKLLDRRVRCHSLRDGAIIHGCLIRQVQSGLANWLPFGSGRNSAADTVRSHCFSLIHFAMKLFFAAPLSAFPSDPTAFGAHASRLHFFVAS
jgi:hypothetical protein